MQLYKYYQITGGEEKWSPIQAEVDLTDKRPTFVTILALDKILEKDTPKEIIEATKYIGPLYFDLDSDELEASIEDSKELVSKLLDYGLKEGDLRLYLSGKKGLHILVDEKCFMGKVAPVLRLPDVYKEIAFKLAVPSLDLRVYTAKRGRMLRTCYNIRPNSNYRVPVSLAELQSLTPELYQQLCKNPRPEFVKSPEYRSEMALLYDAAFQKVSGQKKRKPKPVTPQVLIKDKEIVTRILKGDTVADIGFNQIAIQLAVYAREVGWSSEMLCEQAAELLQNHPGGSRYRTASIRRRELENMHSYVAENSSYEYLSGALARLVPGRTTLDEEGNEVESYEVPQAVYEGPTAYWVKGAESDKVIMNAVLKDTSTMYHLGNTDGVAHLDIMGIKGRLVGPDVNRQVRIDKDALNNALGIHKVLNASGLSFHGTDANARSLYEVLMTELRRSGRGTYITDREGLDYLKIPGHANPRIAAGFPVWATSQGVALPPDLRDEGIAIEFVGSTEESGMFRSDITSIPTAQKACEDDPALKEEMGEMLESLFQSQDHGTMARVLGWMVSSYSRQMFIGCYKQFPLLHVVGPAGVGKSQTCQQYMHLFNYNSSEKVTTPTSTMFSIIQTIMSSASLPLLIDEYKPAMMQEDKLQTFKALLRDSYNQRNVQRGGGNRTNSGFTALSSSPLSAPLIFVSEAIESESAILERSVLATFRGASSAMTSRRMNHWGKFTRNSKLLAHFGHSIAEGLVGRYDETSFKDFFDRIHNRALQKYTLAGGNIEEMTAKERSNKSRIKPRVVFNYAVCEYGLLILRGIVRRSFGDRFDADFQAMVDVLYDNMESLSEASTPEFIKVMNIFSDLSRVNKLEDRSGISIGSEYEVMEADNVRILNLVVRTSYYKYRAWCKTQGTKPLYPSEESFMHALKNSSFFIETGTGTKSISASSVLLRYEEIVEAGMQPFYLPGKR